MFSYDTGNPMDIHRKETLRNMTKCEMTGKLIPFDEVIHVNGKIVSEEGRRILLNKSDECSAEKPEEETIEQAFNIVYPSSARRVICVFIDSFLIALVWFLIILTSMVLGYDIVGSLEGSYFANFVYNMIFYGSFFAYNTFTQIRFGRAFGKILGKCFIIDKNGHPITRAGGLGRAFWSDGIHLINIIVWLLFPSLLTSSVSFFMLYSALNCISLFTDPQGRALHDLISGTTVIRSITPK